MLLIYLFGALLITFRALTNELLSQSHTHVGIGDTIAGQMLVAVKTLFHTGKKTSYFLFMDMRLILIILISCYVFITSLKVINNLDNICW